MEDMPTDDLDAFGRAILVEEGMLEPGEEPHDRKMWRYVRSVVEHHLGNTVPSKPRKAHGYVDR
jgi:hypothetical protein